MGLKLIMPHSIAGLFAIHLPAMAAKSKPRVRLILIQNETGLNSADRLQLVNYGESTERKYINFQCLLSLE